jgi:hypothetical protein
LFKTNIQNSIGLAVAPMLLNKEGGDHFVDNGEQEQ